VPARAIASTAARRQPLEVVGRQRVVLGGERGAVLVGQLLGVELDRQSVRARASNTRRVCSRVKPIVSQNASTASASRARAAAGTMSSHTASIHASGRPANSGGTACAASSVVRTSTSSSAPSRFATASWRSSVSRSSP
jgi:hypothetical protein